jgi:hypothetical protein
MGENGSVAAAFPWRTESAVPLDSSRFCGQLIASSTRRAILGSAVARCASGLMLLGTGFSRARNSWLPALLHSVQIDELVRPAMKVYVCNQCA